MFAFLKRRRQASVIFESALAAARDPALYRDLGVPDTLDGRFDALLLHLWPVFKALQADARLGQAVYDLTFTRMELALRETGVGDLSVGRQVRAMMKAFYGRLNAYDSCRSDDDWRAALRRNLYGTIAGDAFTVPDAMVARARALGALAFSLDDLRAGKTGYAA